MPLHTENGRTPSAPTEIYDGHGIPERKDGILQQNEMGDHEGRPYWARPAPREDGDRCVPIQNLKTGEASRKKRTGLSLAPTNSFLGFDPQAGAISGEVDPAGTVGAQEGCTLQGSQGIRIGQAIRVGSRDAEDGQLRMEAGQPAGWIEGGGTGSCQEQNRKWRKGGVLLQADKAAGIQTDGQ